MAVMFSCAAIVHAVMPFDSARVTRVENKVSFGQISGAQSHTRPATAQDVVKASDFLLTETDSRAELQYQDGSIVRVGQNTVFSFDANTRTLVLKKGTFVAWVPKGLGGATIKTPSFTAALTGTTVKVSTTRIAVSEGSIAVTLKDGTKVSVEAGFYAEFLPDGTFVGKFPFGDLSAGALMTFNGPLGGTTLDPGTVYSLPTIPNITFEDALNSPGVVNKENTKTFVPPPPKETKKSGNDSPY